jgi:protein-tyrosine-phosphatase
MKHRKILFVCTGNQCRSPMAEALFRDMVQKRYAEKGTEFVVSSCGTAGIEGMPATKEAIDVMREEGIALDSHRSRSISGPLLQEADLVLVMAERHYLYIEMFYPLLMPRVHLLKEYAAPTNLRGFSGSMDIDDPIGKDIGAYRGVFRELREAFDAIFMKIGDEL